MTPKIKKQVLSESEIKIENQDVPTSPSTAPSPRIIMAKGGTKRKAPEPEPTKKSSKAKKDKKKMKREMHRGDSDEDSDAGGE